jgi:2-iminobutanoate/2-iminopropanoate deaminase
MMNRTEQTLCTTKSEKGLPETSVAWSWGQAMFDTKANGFRMATSTESLCSVGHRNRVSEGRELRQASDWLIMHENDNRQEGNGMTINRRKFIKTSGASALVAATCAGSLGQTTKPANSEAATSAKAAKAAATSQASKAKPSGVKKPKRKVLTESAPKPVGPYNQAIIAGNTIFVAGQGPMNPKSGKIEVTTFEEQATQTFENLKAIVEAAGATLQNVVSVRVYLASLEDFSKMNAIYRQYFPEDFPARTTIGAQLLLDMLIEADCVAVI